jgi:pimeloyl-ACP methyl ester carboxylesterase
LQALGYTPIGFDAPGHGDSGGRTTTVLEYRAITEQLRRRHGTFEAVVAHSFGVTSAFLALRSGVLADRLIAISGVSDFGYLVTAFVRRLGLNTRVEHQLRRRIELFLITEGDIWTRFSGTHQTREIDVPILVIHDDGDRTVDPGQAAAIIRAYGPQARRYDTTTLGHHRILRDPAVIDTALAFLTAPAEARLRSR